MTYSPLPSFNLFLKLLNPLKVNKEDLLKNWHKNKESGIFMSTTAWSFALISQLRYDLFNKDVCIWLPDYFCNSSLSILRRTKCKLVFYPLNENLEPDLTICKEMLSQFDCPDLFLVVHYFGKPTLLNKVYDFCKSKNAWLIEDAAHILRPVKGVGEKGDFITYSAHKLLPLYDGAPLIIRKKGPSGLDLDLINDYLNNRNGISFLKSLKVKNTFSKTLIHSQLIWLLKKIIQKSKIFPIRTFPFDNSSPENSLIFEKNTPFISLISLKFLDGLKNLFFENAIKRERNQFFWDYYFNNSVNSNLVKSFIRPKNLNWSPYLASYKCEHNNIKKIVLNQNKKKFLITSWPDLPKEILDNKLKYSNAINLKNNLFFLPVHQSLSKKDLSNFVNNTIIKNDHKITFDWNNFTKTKWNDLSLKSNTFNNLLQSYYYGESKSTVNGWKVNRVLIKSNNTDAGIVQILEKKFLNIITIFRINRGPVFFTNNSEINNNIITKLLRLGNIKKLNILFFSFELINNFTNIGLLFTNKLRYISNKYYSSSIINLDNTLENIRSNFSSKWRNMLVFSEKQNLTLDLGNSKDHFEWISGIHKKNMSLKKFKGIDSKTLNQLFKNQDENNYLCVLRVSLNNSYVGAVCISIHSNSSTYLIGWTNEKGRHSKSNYYLLWESIKFLKENKINFFDLGGIDIEDTFGISSFKLGLNGEYYSLTPSGFQF